MAVGVVRKRVRLGQARSVFVRVSAIAIVVCIGAGSHAGAAAGPDPETTVTSAPGDLPGLLEVPDPLPEGEPGDLLASEAFPSDDFPFAVEAHQILYRSSDAKGVAIPVSGYVLVPVGVPEPAGGRAVVAWAHGTTGLVDGCAPSLSAQEGGRLNGPANYDRIDQLLAAGYIVVASDYPGLGTPGVHPYLDGLGEGRAVLDSIRAARTFGGTDTAVIVGFSQGSQAAIFAGAEWPTYAPELDVKGVVPIGTPSRFGLAFGALDLPVVRQYINLLLAGIVAGHPELDRTEILTPSGEEAYDEFAEADRPDGACISPGFQIADDLAADPMSIPSWRAAFEANTPGTRLVPAPVLMVQSENDEQALAFLADGVCRDLQSNGTDLRMWRYDDESHVESVSVSSDDPRAGSSIGSKGARSPTTSRSRARHRRCSRPASRRSRHRSCHPSIRRRSGLLRRPPPVDMLPAPAAIAVPGRPTFTG